MSHRPLPQLRRRAFCDVERRRNHLAGGSVHADEMDEAWEILQVSEINWVKVNTLRIIVCFKKFSKHMLVVKTPKICKNMLLEILEM